MILIVLMVQRSQLLKKMNKTEISIVTSGPGEALYEKFGHTAIRVKDPVLKLDLIYNYGIFDFDGPNFYLKFIKTIFLQNQFFN